MMAPQIGIDISSASAKNQQLSQMVELNSKRKLSSWHVPCGRTQRTNRAWKAFLQPWNPSRQSDSLEQEVILNTLNEAYGPDAFTSMFNLFLWIYPVISPMNNWTNDITYYFNTKAVKLQIVLPVQSQRTISW